MRVKLLHSRGGCDCMVLPAPVAGYIILRLQAWIARFDYLAHGSAHHDIANVDRISVGPNASDAATHVGIDGEVDCLDEDLSRLRRR